MARYEKIGDAPARKGGQAPQPRQPDGRSRSTGRSTASRPSQKNVAGGIRSPSPDTTSISREENPVELCLKIAVKGLGLTLLLWCIGLLFVALAVCNAAGRASWAFIFTPFWLGDIMALAVQARVLAAACSFRFLPNERLALRRYLQDQSTRAVDMNYLPLVQRVVLAVAVSVPALLLLVAFQVLLCLRLEGAAGAMSPSAAAVALPLFLAEGVGLAHFCLLRDHSLASASCWLLLFASTASLAHKADAGGAAAFPFAAAFAPAWALTALLAGLAAGAWVDHARARHFLARRQRLALNLYAAALALAALAEAVTAAHELGGAPGVPAAAAPLLFAAAGALAAGGVYVVAKRNARRLLLTKGYNEPLPLSKTSAGWEPAAGGGSADWALLGPVARRAPRGGAGGGGGGRLGPGGARVHPQDSYSGSRTSSFSGGVSGSGSQNFQRSDSGSYADLYDDV